MYNTLGNFLIHPQAGLLFLDLATYRTLQLSGRASVTFGDTTGQQSGEPDRCCWTFLIEEWVLLENLNDMEWTFLDYSPFNPAVVIS